MARIPDEVINQVRSSINILDVVRQRVDLKKSGRNYFGLCPFHSEKTPSFSVDEEKQIFHCFSCGRGGNVFSFLMELDGSTFPEAVNKIAEEAGIELSDSYQTAGVVNSQANQEKRQLLALYKEVSELYHYILTATNAGQEALDYLHQRGITDEMISEFQLGYAPEEKLLEAYFQEHKVDIALIQKSGLFIDRTDGSMYERFRDRVMFPICDEVGRVIAFSGRLLHKDDSKQQPKYLNSPEMLLFNKGKVLFNYDKARQASRDDHQIILFEGFMDVLSAYQAGVKNGVASMGTSLTSEQINLIERIVPKINICYDGDQAGQQATKRAIELITPYSQKITLSVTVLPEQLDPDEFIKKYGPDQFRRVIKQQQLGVLDFYLSFLATDRNLANESDQALYIQDFLQVLAKQATVVEQDLYLNRLGQQFDLDKASLQAQLRQILAVTDRQPRTHQSKYREDYSQFDQFQIPVVTQEVNHFDKVERAERLLLYRMLTEHTVWDQIENTVDFAFVHRKYESIWLIARGYFNIHSDYDSASFIDFLQDEDLKQTIVNLEMHGFTWESSSQEINDCLNVIMNQSPLEAKIKELSEQLQQAKRLNNRELITSLTMNLVDLYRQRQAVR